MPSPTGSVSLWQPVQAAWVACAVRRWRAVRFGEFGSLNSEKSTLPGGSGTFWQSSSSRIARPRSVGELRPGCENSAAKLTCESRPARGSSFGNS